MSTPQETVAAILIRRGVWESIATDMAEEVVSTLLPGTGALEGLDNDALLALLPRAQATIAAADSNIRWIATVLRTRRVSYAVIGRALGVSRQAAWERFSKDTAR